MSIAKLVTDWGGFEKLVAQLHETGEVKVEHNVVLVGRSGAPRQIDVLIRQKQGLYEHLIVVECKFWNAPVDRAQVDALATTVREVGASRGVIFSAKGFQSGAITQAKQDAIDLFVVRDLTNAEWALPGRVVDLFLQIIQPSIGKAEIEGGMAVGQVEVMDGAARLNLEFGADGPASSTPTLKRDGISIGPSLEQYLFDAIQESMQSLSLFILNGGEKCTRYLMRPVNVLPTTPFMIPRPTGILIVPKVTIQVAIKITQSRITIDRAEKYLFALAVENCVNGVVSSAARSNDSTHTTVAELIKESSSDSGEQPLVNGSILRVFMKGFFPFEETASLRPGPHYPHL
jgi:hypothetical protein